MFGKNKQSLLLALSLIMASMISLVGCSADAAAEDLCRTEENSDISYVFGYSADTEVTLNYAELKDKDLLQERYIVGETLVIPENSLLINGEEYGATVSIRLPDGTAVRSRFLTLSQAGKYTVSYIANADGKYYSDSVSFYAEKNAMTGTASENSETGWLDCTLSNLEVLTYNVPIDLSSMTKEDELISLFINASEDGTRDFQEYIIVLTDAYDSSNSVYVRVKAEVNFSTNPDDPQYYSRYQAYVGADFNDRNQFVGCEKDKIHRASIYGTPIHNSFCNMSKADSITREMDALSLRWDNEEKAFYVTSPGFYLSPTLVADMDDPAHFKTGWSGFHNDTVYISLYAKEVVGTANITIKHIGGEKISVGTVEDDTAPSLTVDFGEYTESSIPNAVVGSPYKLFGAYTEDLNMSNFDVKTTVYYNYSGNNARMVPIVNGAFTPEYAGTYTVIYSARDDFGNVAQKLVYIDAIRSSSIDFSVQDGNAVAGEKTLIPAPIMSGTNQNTGKYNLAVIAAKDGNEEIIYNGSLDGYTPVEYRFMSFGEWKVAYVVSDYSRFTRMEASYTVVSGGNVIAEAFDDLAIDRYFISGSTYLLPQINVVSFTGGVSTYPAKIRVIYGSDQAIELDGNVFVPDASQMGSSVEIVYYDENDESVKICGTRDIYDIGENGGLCLDKLFTATGAVVTPASGSIDFTATQSTQINVLSKQYAEKFTMRFNLFADAALGNSLGNFNIILTDSVNSNISLKINLKNTLGSQNSSGSYNSVMYINDDTSYMLYLTQSFAGANASIYDIVYDNSAKTVTIEGSYIDVAYTLNGDRFEGFPSGAVYVTYEMDSVVGEGCFELYSMNSQIYTNYGYDNVKPQVVVEGTYNTYYQHGSTVTTATAWGIDAICGYSNVTVTIRSLNGGVLTTIDGLKASGLDASRAYSVCLSEYGDYMIQYTTTDKNGNKASQVSYIFSVEDREKPTITVKGEMQKYAFVGDKLVLPEIEITDNNSENMQLYVVVVTPKGVYSKIDYSDYTFTVKGTYTVILTAIDAGGNMVNSSYFVEVL